MESFVFCPIFFNFLKGLSCRFRNDLPHYEHVRDAHNCEEEECPRLAPSEKDRRKLPDEICSYP